MIYIKRVTTPANTLESDPLRSRLTVTRGRLRGGWVYFPYGPAGELHLQIKVGIHQIFPFNPDSDLALDDAVVPLDFCLEIDTPPYSVDIYTWNDDADNDHTLTVCLSITPVTLFKREIESLSEILEILQKQAEKK